MNKIFVLNADNVLQRKITKYLPTYDITVFFKNFTRIKLCDYLVIHNLKFIISYYY